jgi:hypothetical protein
MERIQKVSQVKNEYLLMFFLFIRYIWSEINVGAVINIDKIDLYILVGMSVIFSIKI